MGVLGRYRMAKIAVILLAACCLFASPASQAGAATALQLQEHKIKAGLVYNFLKYTDWQLDGTGRLRVCLMGGDPFDGYLFPLQGRTAQKQPIEVVSLRDISNAGSCSAVVIHRNLENGLADILRTLKQYNVLTISDIRGFSRRGGMIELATGRDRRIHLYINTKAVEAAGLGIQERLLKLAELVE